MTCSKTSVLRLLGLGLVALTVSSPSQSQGQWQPCAGQGEVCRFEGQATVRYGADGRYAYRVARNRITCDVGAFGGDPAYGVVKQCDVSYNADPRETRETRGPATSRGWTHCAGEEETCRVPGPARIRYGVDDRYVYRNVSRSFLCSARVFGDPAYGERKTCEYQLAGRGYDDDRGADQGWDRGRGWEYCGSEGDRCSFRGQGEVRYGTDERFVVRRAVNGMPCTVNAFGRDPAYGENKQCHVRVNRR
jgi:hypothetical protein